MAFEVPVLEGPSFRVFPRQSDHLVILFSGTNKSDGRFDFFGYAERTSASVILVNNGANHWYQAGVPGLGATVVETAEAIRRWAVRLAASDISLIGASMGGSGAVMYAALTGGRALAFSFEAHVRHVGSRSAKYIPESFPLAYPDLTPLIRAARHPVMSIMGGGDVIDVVEASRLLDVPNLELRLLRGVDHGVPRYLRQLGRLDAVLDAFVTGEPLPPFPEEDDDLRVPGYAEALAEAHLALLGGRIHDALTAGERALQALPTSFAAQMVVGRALTLAKDPGRALIHYGAAIVLAPLDFEARLFFGACLRRLKRFAHAIAFHEQTLTMWPREHRAHFDLGLAFLSSHQVELARAAVGRAIQLAPKNQKYIDRLADLAKR